MEIVIFNALLYTSTFLIYLVNKKSFDLGLLFLFIYSVVAIVAIPHHFFLDIIYKRDISILPFIYLFFVFLLFFRPYLGWNMKNVVLVRSMEKLRFLAFIYFISSIIAVKLMAPTALANLQSGEWGKIRQEIYTTDKVLLYENGFEHLMLLINQYLRGFVILVFFQFIYLRKIGALYTCLLGFSLIIPVFLISMIQSSRGMLIDISLELLAAYVIFKNFLPTFARKIIRLGALISLFGVLSFSFAVTNSRFGENSGAEVSTIFSLLDYFGQPMLVFNHGVAGMEGFANGKYFFSYILDMFEINTEFNEVELGGKFGQGFMTFVGNFFIDFGPWLTLGIAGFIPIFINNMVRKEIIYIENLFLFYYFYCYFLKGIFVVAPGSIVGWLIAIFIYLFNRISFRHD
jgi:oligosaccharide repeat unit polymerase